jgi:hypothetical protein
MGDFQFANFGDKNLCPDVGVPPEEALRLG